MLNPVSMAEAKQHANVESNDDDGLLFGLIDSAVAYAEHYTGQKFMTQTWTAYFDGLSSVIELPFYPIQSVVVKYINGTEQTLSTDDYRLDDKNNPGVVEIINMPDVDDGYNTAWVEVVCGTDNQAQISGAIKSAVLMLVAHMFENREASTIPQAHELPLGVSAFLDTEKVSFI